MISSSGTRRGAAVSGIGRLRGLIGTAGPAALPLALGVAVGLAAASLWHPGSGGLEPGLPLETVPPASWGVPGSAEAVSPGELQKAAFRGLLGTLSALGLAGLLLALGTVGILVTARGSLRRRSLAVRGALGASRRRLLGRLLRPSLSLLAVGLVSGVVVGLGAVSALRWGWPHGEGLGSEVGGVFMDTLLVVSVAGLPTLLLCLLPARYGTRDLPGSLSAGSRSTADPREGGLRRVLTVVQLTGSLALLSTALLVLRGVPRADLGNTPADGPDDRTVLFEISGADSLELDERRARYGELLERVRSILTLEAESLASPGAWVGLGRSDFVLADCGACVSGGLPLPFVGATVQHHVVSPGFFEMARVEVVSGRAFDAGDRPDAEPVALVTRPFALSSFEGGDPVGRRVRVGGFDDWFTVVGVVEEPDAVVLGRRPGARPAVYLSALQHPPSRAELAVRSTAPSDGVGWAISDLARAAGLQATEPGETLAARRQAAREPARWATVVAGLLGVVTVLVAIMGVHRVARVEVRARRRALGIRKALGASPRSVTWYVVARSLRASLLAVVLAIPLVVVLTARLQESLGEVPLFDPVAFGVTASALVVSGALGSLGPAREAARVPPALAMSEE